MNFDRLIDIYAMVKSNGQFDKIILTGLTGFHERSDQSAQIVQQTLTVPILSVNKYFGSSLAALSGSSPALIWDAFLRHGGSGSAACDL